MGTEAATALGVMLGVSLTLGLAACGPSSSGPKSCRKSCSEAADCGQLAINWKCDDGACLPDQCSNDSECIAEYSGWQMEGCEVGGCMQGDVCIRRGGSTYCANRKFMRKECMGETSPLEAEKADGSESVKVCANQNYRCSNSQCVSGSGGDGGCSSDADCTGSQTCEEGACRCSSDSDCSELGDGYICAGR